jgi:hypothetical protein
VLTNLRGVVLTSGYGRLIRHIVPAVPPEPVM